LFSEAYRTNWDALERQNGAQERHLINVRRYLSQSP
jgi:hypothetical protein